MITILSIFVAGFNKLILLPLAVLIVLFLVAYKLRLVGVFAFVAFISSFLATILLLSLLFSRGISEKELFIDYLVGSILWFTIVRGEVM